MKIALTKKGPGVLDFPNTKISKACFFLYFVKRSKTGLRLKQFFVFHSFPQEMNITISSSY